MPVGLGTVLKSLFVGSVCWQQCFVARYFECNRREVICQLLHQELAYALALKPRPGVVGGETLSNRLPMSDKLLRKLYGNR